MSVIAKNILAVSGKITPVMNYHHASSRSSMYINNNCGRKIKMNYWLRMWQKYADFQGRDTRAEYWYAFLVNIIIGIVLSLLVRTGMFFTVIAALYSLAGLIPGIALFTRRLHDVGKSGKLWIAQTIPLVLAYILIFAGLTSGSIGLIVFGGVCSIAALAVEIYIIVLLATQGTPGANQYGPDPRSAAFNSAAPNAGAREFCGKCGAPFAGAEGFCTHCGEKRPVARG
jgi:uncharacterized membrane protein YhaH (DUF805 family)